MIDRKGHMIHIDFGFMIQNSPGNMNFEAAPFKLTAEYIELMDGVDSDLFEYFKSLITAGLLEVRKNMDDLIRFITIMMKNSVMPCFKNSDSVVAEIEARMRVTGLTTAAGAT
jgi:phosphatidylinositol kinase/protein kinase (PI-3  family)